MSVKSNLLCWAMAFVLVIGIATPVSASQFGRVGLDYLVAENETIVIGEVPEAHSYWAASESFILTDAKVAVSEILKGDPGLSEVTVTLPGGTVGDRSVVVVDGAELQPGKSYVLFLHRGNLPGAVGVQILRDHRQGVFEISTDQNGPQAISQANGHALVHDAFGAATALQCSNPKRSLQATHPQIAGRSVRPKKKSSPA